MGKKNKYSKINQPGNVANTQIASASTIINPPSTVSNVHVGHNSGIQSSGQVSVGVPPPSAKSPQKTAPVIERGVKGKKMTLETNYLKLNLSKMPDHAYHYDVKIEPDRPKKFMRSVFETFTKKVFPGNSLAYDGRSNAYSPVKLCDRALGSEIMVGIVDGNTKISFKVTMKPTDDLKIDLKSLKT